VATRTKRTAVFASFDYDNDRFLKEALIQQSRRKDSPFAMADWSIKEESRSWRSEARSRIERADLVIVICGYQTHRATGVTKEIAIARDVGTRYVLLRGHKTGWVRRPSGTWFWETIHDWTWENLR
jgi:hypothetical protein